jgi:hypothetical protein
MSRATLIAALLVLAACGSPAERSPAEQAAASEPGGAASLAVQWLFEPTPNERARLDSVLQAVGAEASGPDFRLGGELHRFASPAAPDRYLLVASRDTTPAPMILGEQEFLLYAIGPAGVSAPHRVSGSPESSHPFAVAQLADFDADAVPDLAFCTDGSEEEGGVLSILGHREGRWYRIAPPAEHGLCR